jgi:outer membrane murein-binding lipoprotein Lpp
MSAELRVDPNARIPAAAKAAGKRADDLHKQVYSKEPVAEMEPKDGAENPDEPATTAPVTDAPVQTAATPPTPVTPEGNQPVSQPASTQGEDDGWKHKYTSMKGRFDRAQGQIQSMAEQISNLNRMLATMKAEPQAAQPQAPRAERLLTPQEEQDYGTEFLEVVSKKAKETFSPEVQALREELAKVTDQLKGVSGVVTQDAEARFFSDLNRGLPAWTELNNDQNFLSWLKLPDAYSGVIRHELLNAAYERKDAPRVLAFFNGFLAEEAAVDPANLAPKLTPAAPAPGKVPLETFAAPGRAKSTAAQAPAEKPIIHRNQISQFYLDVAAGKYRGRDEEKNRLEGMIFDAEKDGRIR